MPALPEPGYVQAFEVMPHLDCVQRRGNEFDLSRRPAFGVVPGRAKDPGPPKKQIWHTQLSGPAGAPVLHARRREAQIGLLGVCLAAAIHRHNVIVQVDQRLGPRAPLREIIADALTLVIDHDPHGAISQRVALRLGRANPGNQVGRRKVCVD